MIKFTCVMIKEVAGYLKHEENLEKLAGEMFNKNPLLCFHVTGHLFAKEVAELPEIKEVIDKTYVSKKYLVEIDMLEYVDGNSEFDDQDELDYVMKNFDMLVEDEKIDLINTDYLTMDISDCD